MEARDLKVNMFMDEPARISFVDSTVFAAMDYITKVVQSGECSNRDVLDAALIVLNVAMKPIESTGPSAIDWKFPT